MKKINWVPSAIAIGIVASSMLAINDGAIAQGVKAPASKVEKKAEDDSDPLTKALLLDHPAEVRAIIRKLDAGDREGAIDGLADLHSEYGLPALGRASDAYAIDVARKASAVVDVLASREPEGCRYFVAFQMRPGGNSIPELTERFRDFLEARHLAYEDGKSRAPVTRLSAAEILALVTENLGVSTMEMGLFLIPDKVPDAQMCSILKRFWNVSGVPEARRGDWARAVVSYRR